MRIVRQGKQHLDTELTENMSAKGKQDLSAVELFAGIGGFRIACDNLGIRTVYANDLCPKAAKVYNNRFGGVVLADLRTIQNEIPKHDVLTAGIPCQPFSAAGKKRGIQDPRGTLFQVVVEILAEANPKFFVIENVKRLLSMDQGRHFATLLDALSTLNYVIEWRLINAISFGLPQNRQRVVIIGTRADDPSNLGVKLATAKELGSLTPSQLRSMFTHESWEGIAAHGKKFLNWGRAYHGRFTTAFLTEPDVNSPQVRLHEILVDSVQSSFDFTESTLERIGSSRKIHEFVNGVEILYNQGGGARMGYTIFGTSGIAPTVTSTTSRHYERYFVNGRYRRLTNVEYARIQGFADDHCNAVSTYDQYALYGNAFPPPMAEWVIGRAISDEFVTMTDVQTRGQLELIST